MKCVMDAKPASKATSEMRACGFESSFLAFAMRTIERYCVKVMPVARLKVLQKWNVLAWTLRAISVSGRASPLRCSMISRARETSSGSACNCCVAICSAAIERWPAKISSSRRTASYCFRSMTGLPNYAFS